MAHGVPPDPFDRMPFLFYVDLIVEIGPGTACSPREKAAESKVRASCRECAESGQSYGSFRISAAGE